MTLDELLENVRTARDAAVADASAFERERDALPKTDIESAGKRLQLSIDLVASDTVAAALSRILGETRTRRGERSTP